jgi:hypothetical protein
LIESGGYQGDPEKQYIRKINFMIILNALHQIATRGYEQYTTAQYFAIPDNGFQLMDLIINEMQVNVQGEWYPLDIAIRRRETENSAGYFMSASVEDLGDMQIFFGFETLDATGLQYLDGKVYPTAFESVKAISEEKAMELLREGFMAVKVKTGDARQLHELPILVLKTTEKFSSGWMTGASTNFFLAKDGKPRYAVVNGYLIDLENPKKQDFRNRIF